MSGRIAVIICAAGASRRFGGRRKKPFVDVAGRAVFLRSVELFSNRDDVGQVLLAISAADRELVEVKWGANLKFYNVEICEGGAERFETVSRALSLVKEGTELIAVHDAVRCCLKDKWVDECFAKASETGAAILASRVVATLKQVEGGRIVRTVDRQRLYEAQTPQVFRTAVLREAYAGLEKLDKSRISDDAQLVEALGQEVSIVETDASNVKITQASDIAVAEAILASRGKAKRRRPVGPYSEAQW